MGINPSKGIYDDVDKARYRSNRGCLVWMVLLILLVVAVFVYIVLTQG